MIIVMKIEKRVFLFGSLVFVMLCASQRIARSIETVSPQETELIGDLVFENECNRKVSCLISWNEGENFLSLGIGHFIWYPSDLDGPFYESFPKFLSFAEAKGVKLPSWFDSLSAKHAPWRKRDQFLEELNRGNLDFLQKFLIETKELQAEFIIERFRISIPQIMQAISSNLRDDIRRKISFMLYAKGGLYPLVDYVNFNGEGILNTERYKAQGWGLLQVLEEMKMPLDENRAVLEFVNAIDIILERRVANSPPERNENRWLPGWKNRIRTYLMDENCIDFQINYTLRKTLLEAMADNLYQGPIDVTDSIDMTQSVPGLGIVT